MPEISQAWLALIGAILGGSGLKFIEHYLSRPKIRDDSAAAFRKELREELAALREELNKTEEALDAWRTKYFDLLEQFTHAKMDRDAALQKIQDAADAALNTHHGTEEKRTIRHARDVAKDELSDE